MDLSLEGGRREGCMGTFIALTSRSFIKFTLPRDSGVGYEPVPVVGIHKYLIVEGVVDGMPRLGGVAIADCSPMMGTVDKLLSFTFSASAHVRNLPSLFRYRQMQTI